MMAKDTVTAKTHHADKAHTDDFVDTIRKLEALRLDGKPALTHNAALLLLAYVLEREGEMPKDIPAFAMTLTGAPPVWHALRTGNQVAFAKMCGQYKLPVVSYLKLQGTMNTIQVAIEAAAA